MPKSITERAAELVPIETVEEKRIRELSTRPVPLTNPEIQEAMKLLLGARAAQIRRTRRPRP